MSRNCVQLKRTIRSADVATAVGEGKALRTGTGSLVSKSLVLGTRRLQFVQPRSSTKAFSKRRERELTRGSIGAKMHDPSSVAESPQAT